MIKIGDKVISNDCKPYFIADIAANHDGSLERALRLIELAKEAGADAAKFQNFKAKEIVSKKGFDTMKKMTHQASWSKSVFEVYQDASISQDWTPILKAKCDEVGIEYMTSPYDFDSVDKTDPYVNAIKIGSGDITWLDIIDYIASKGKPVLIATGASTFEDVERAYKVIKRRTDKIVLMQCNTNYTASGENFKYINLNVLNTYKKEFPDVILGLSDHTKGYSTVLGAFVLGARVFEKHFTDDNNREGPDHKFAMNPKSFREMVDATNELYYAMGDGIKVIEKNEKDAAIVQRRAIYSCRKILEGETITKDMLFPLRPIKEGGIPPYEIDSLLGKKARHTIDADTMVKKEDFE